MSDPQIPPGNQKRNIIKDRWEPERGRQAALGRAMDCTDHQGCRIFYDEDTLFKVRDALNDSGLNDQQAHDAIREMQNAGILFRERKPS